MATSFPISARSYRDAYAPAVASPLNPTRGSSSSSDSSSSPSSPSSTTSAKPAYAHLRRRGKNARKFTSVSPTQRLLRQKAAEAWRGELLRRQAARSEVRKIQAQAAQKALEARIQKVLTEAPSSKPLIELPGSRNNGPQPYAFHMPDVGFFTPRKVVLAMGRIRRSNLPAGGPPSLGNENFMRVPMAA
jgi:hypothetical protein